jgi:CheY-like chemotaxis protein
MSMSILVVVSNTMIRTMYSAGLIGFGYPVEEARTLAEAIECIEAGFVPDVVITDMLVDENGHHVADYLRQQVGNPNLRVMVSTAEPTPTPTADVVIPKPANIVEVVALL